MKKYTKPMIVFESFSLSTNIAGDCEVMNNNTPAKGSCAYRVQFGKVTRYFFTDSVGAACTTQENSGVFFDANSPYNGFCYHIPDESYTLFNS